MQINACLEPGLCPLTRRMSKQHILTLRMAGKESIDSKNMVLKRKCYPDDRLL